MTTVCSVCQWIKKNTQRRGVLHCCALCSHVCRYFFSTLFTVGYFLCDSSLVRSLALCAIYLICPAYIISSSFLALVC